MMAKQIVQYLSNTVTLSTLASAAAIIVNTQIDSSREQGVRLKKMWMPMPSWFGKTAGEGPILYGLCWELTSIELAEALNSDPQGEDDTVEVEEAGRKVIVLGSIPAGGTADVNPSLYERVSIPWKDVPEGSTLKFFVFNASFAALSTGTIVRFNATALAEWRDD